MGKQNKWLHEINKSRGLAILSKINLNYDLTKSNQNPQGRFFSLETKVKKFVFAHYKYLWPVCRRF